MYSKKEIIEAGKFGEISQIDINYLIVILEEGAKDKSIPIKPPVKPEIAVEYLEQAIHYVELLGVRGYSAIDSSKAEMKVRNKILKFRDYLKTLRR